MDFDPGRQNVADLRSVLQSAILCVCACRFALTPPKLLGLPPKNSTELINKSEDHVLVNDVAIEDKIFLNRIF